MGGDIGKEVAERVEEELAALPDLLKTEGDEVDIARLVRTCLDYNTEGTCKRKGVNLFSNSNNNKNGASGASFPGRLRKGGQNDR